MNDSSSQQPSSEESSSGSQLLIAAAAAFCTYFCMYAFRKPFTAATFEGETLFGAGLKTVLVVSQLLGYMLSKFIGIKVVSEMPAKARAWGIVGLILFAEAALVGFALVPLNVKFVMLFLNGLPLGMVFGLVLAYLEGRKHTEALSAALCASFIISSGVVKSVGRWLIVDQGISEYSMPMIAGAMFLLPLIVSVWFLQKTPPPNQQDVKLRNARSPMDGVSRGRFLVAYWPGLSLFIFVYVALTIIRTIRDDFGVEIWRDMGVEGEPSIFARSETAVAVCVTAFNALAILMTHNLTAIRVTIGALCVSFGLVATSGFLQANGTLSPFVFMVVCGIGLYVPYVAFHTTLFERLVAASQHPGNLGFLMYLADAIGYLGYAFVMVLRSSMKEPTHFLPFFCISLYLVSTLSIVALIGSMIYFHRVLSREDAQRLYEEDPQSLEELAPVE
ncbi:MAG: hypothetical protein HUJ26_21360 [Planctomycetaceae bacterium]|nr:hypothetical protein [Planctomycetaceae bacterium]